MDGAPPSSAACAHWRGFLEMGMLDSRLRTPNPPPHPVTALQEAWVVGDHDHNPSRGACSQSCWSLDAALGPAHWQSRAGVALWWCVAWVVWVFWLCGGLLFVVPFCLLVLLFAFFGVLPGFGVPPVWPCPRRCVVLVRLPASSVLCCSLALSSQCLHCRDVATTRPRT